MVYSQLFSSEEEQQNAIRRIQQEQTGAGRHAPSPGSLNRGSTGNANQLMQQLQQQAQALNQFNPGGAGGANTQASLMQALPLGGGLGGNALAGFAGGNLGGVNGLGGNLSNLANLGNPNFGQLGGPQLGGHQLGGNLQLGNELGGNLGQYRGNLGNLGGASLLEMQRAQHLLEAMASSNNANSVGQFNSVMNANQQALLQSRLGGNLLQPNTQLPGLSQEQLMNKSQVLANFPNTFNSLGGPMEGENGGNLGKKRRFNGVDEGGMRKRPNGRGPGNNELKLNSDLNSIDDQPRKPEPKSRRKAKTFPVKLMQALIENSNEDAVAWLPDGKSFVIVNPDLFVDYVLKKTFKECKYASFVRKLHRWGFVRLTSGTGTDCFHHPLFQRNRGDLCARIVCTPRDPAKASESEKRVAAATNMSNDKPPSLAGVEKFFRSRPIIPPPPNAPTIPPPNTNIEKEEEIDPKPAKEEEAPKEDDKDTNKLENENDADDDDDDDVDENEVPTVQEEV